MITRALKYRFDEAYCGKLVYKEQKTAEKWRFSAKKAAHKYVQNKCKFTVQKPGLGIKPKSFGMLNVHKSTFAQFFPNHLNKESHRLREKFSPVRREFYYFST